MNDYGKRDKRISFMDTDKRNAEMIIRLKHDGITKTKFFRAILTGYLGKDPEIISFIEKYKETSLQPSRQRSIVKGSLEGGKENSKKFGLGEDELDDIFDILEKEHPEL
jgi:hypothetical protein